MGSQVDIVLVGLEEVKTIHFESNGRSTWCGVSKDGSKSPSLKNISRFVAITRHFHSLQ